MLKRDTIIAINLPATNDAASAGFAARELGVSQVRQFKDNAFICRAVEDNRWRDLGLVSEVFVNRWHLVRRQFAAGERRTAMASYPWSRKAMHEPEACDPFREVRTMTDHHRSTHGCWAYPFNNGSLLGVLSGMLNARQILELGTGLGYSALWLASGAPDAKVDTVEQDPEHARLAMQNIRHFNFSGKIKVRIGEFNSVLTTLHPGYDLIFFDGFAPDSRDLAQIQRLLRYGGLLVSANLNLSGPKAADYRAALFDESRWLTTIVNHPDDTALSVHQDGTRTAERVRVPEKVRTSAV